MYNGIENLLKMRSHSYQKLGILCNVAKSLINFGTFCSIWE